MEKNMLAGKTAPPPAVLLGALPSPRPTTPWTLQWSEPNRSLQNLMHARFYASSMGRFLKPDNLIGNMANPQSWNLYSYVNGNPVNFNDPTGHVAGGGRSSPAYMVQMSGASWMNWGAYQSFYGSLYGGNVAFGGGGGAGSSQNYTAQYGVWNYTTGYMENVRTGPDIAYQDPLTGEWHFVSGEEQVVHGAQWVYQTYQAQYSIVSAQPMQQTYMRAMPPSRFHFGQFLYLNAICVPNTMVWTCLGSAIGFKTAGPYGTAFGAVGGLVFSEMQYYLLSLYPEGWVPPKEPEAPPVGLGKFTLEP